MSEFNLPLSCKTFALIEICINFIFGLAVSVFFLIPLLIMFNIVAFWFGVVGTVIDNGLPFDLIILTMLLVMGGALVIFDILSISILLDVWEIKFRCWGRHIAGVILYERI